MILFYLRGFLLFYLEFNNFRIYYSLLFFVFMGYFLTSFLKCPVLYHMGAQADYPAASSTQSSALGTHPPARKSKWKGQLQQ